MDPPTHTHTRTETLKHTHITSPQLCRHVEMKASQVLTCGLVSVHSWFIYWYNLYSSPSFTQPTSFGWWFNYWFYLQIKDNPLTNADLMLIVRTIHEITNSGIGFVDASVSFESFETGHNFMKSWNGNPCNLSVCLSFCLSVFE